MEQHPSFTQVYAESWHSARAVLGSRPRFYGMWIAAAAAVGVLSLLVPDSLMQSSSGGPQVAAAIPVSLFGYSLMAGVLSYFVLADAVRTFRPAFAMTVPVFFLVIVINMAYSIAIQIAAYCFLIPAFYVGPKLWLWLPNFLLGSSDANDLSDSFLRSWRDTNNLYWPTFGLMAVISVVSVAVLIVAIAIAGLLIEVFHPLAILTTPLLLAVTLYMVAQVDRAWLGWAVAVRRHADEIAVPVTAAPASAAPHLE